MAGGVGVVGSRAEIVSNNAQRVSTRACVHTRARADIVAGTYATYATLSARCAPRTRLFHFACDGGEFGWVCRAEVCSIIIIAFRRRLLRDVGGAASRKRNHYKDRS